MTKSNYYSIPIWLRIAFAVITLVPLSYLSYIVMKGLRENPIGASFILLVIVLPTLFLLLFLEYKWNQKVEIFNDCILFFNLFKQTTLRYEEISYADYIDKGLMLKSAKGSFFVEGSVQGIDEIFRIINTKLPVEKNRIILRIPFELKLDKHYSVVISFIFFICISICTLFIIWIFMDFPAKKSQGMIPVLVFTLIICGLIVLYGSLFRKVILAENQIFYHRTFYPVITINKNNITSVAINQGAVIIKYKDGKRNKSIRIPSTKIPVKKLFEFIRQYASLE